MEKQFSDIEDLLGPIISRIACCSQTDPFSVIPSGLTALDNITLGMEPGEVWSVVGRPAMGKHCFLYSMLSHWLKIEKSPEPYLFMVFAGHEDIGYGLLSITSRVDRKNLRSGKISSVERSSLATATELISKKPMFLKNIGLIHVHEMINMLTDHRKDRPFLLVIDSLDLLTHPASTRLTVKDRALELDRCLIELRQFLKTNNGILLILHSINSNVEHRPNKRPMLSDISSHAEPLIQHSDVIISLFRSEVYNQEAEERGVAEVTVLKNSKGTTDMAYVAFHPQFGLFENKPRSSMFE